MSVQVHEELNRKQHNYMITYNMYALFHRQQHFLYQVSHKLNCETYTSVPDVNTTRRQNKSGTF